MGSLLDIATELEARDTRVAGELARVDVQQADVEEIRVHAQAAAAFLASLPAAIAAHARDEEQAVQLFREAARQGNTNAQLMLLACYVYGVGMAPQTPPSAVVAQARCRHKLL